MEQVPLLAGIGRSMTENVLLAILSLSRIRMTRGVYVTVVGSVSSIASMSCIGQAVGDGLGMRVGE